MVVKIREHLAYSLILLSFLILIITEWYSYKSHLKESLTITSIRAKQLLNSELRTMNMLSISSAISNVIFFHAGSEGEKILNGVILGDELLSVIGLYDRSYEFVASNSLTFSGLYTTPRNLALPDHILNIPTESYLDQGEFRFNLSNENDRQVFTVIKEVIKDDELIGYISFVLNPSKLNFLDIGRLTVFSENQSPPDFCNKVTAKIFVCTISSVFSIKSFIKLNWNVLSLLLLVHVIILFFFFFIKRRYIIPFLKLKNNMSLLPMGKWNKIDNRLFPNTLKPMVDAFNSSVDQFIDLKNKEQESTKSETAFRISRQVAHDIRSPLLALSMVEPYMNELSPEIRDIVKKSISRINNIASDLLKSDHKILPIEVVEVRIVGLLLEIINEKRVEYRNIEGLVIKLLVTYEMEFVSVHAQAVDLGRVLSNLINNSIEALENGKGVIEVLLRKVDNNVILQITDNGKGIPEDVLMNLGGGGYSYGKNGGSGLGLFHAIQQVKRWGGDLKIRSSIGHGTSVELWFKQFSFDASMPTNAILIKLKQILLIVDDDSSVHNTWKLKLQRISITSGIQVIHLYDSSDIHRIINDFYPMDNILILIDYELGKNSETGLKLILDNNLQSNSYLVTGRADETDIRQQCKKNNIRLIRKHDLKDIKLALVDTGELFL